MDSEKTQPTTGVDCVVLLLCPFCGHNAAINEGFDIDCESTTAWISCSFCDAKYGPIYPDSKQEVIDWAQEWNARRTDGLERWIEGEIEKLSVNVRSYHRECALRECHVQLKKLLNGLGL